MVSDTMYPAPQAILKSLIPSLRTKIAHPLILRPNLKVKPDQILLERKHQLGSNSRKISLAPNLQPQRTLRKNVPTYS
jgi:hypothetical protein